MSVSEPPPVRTDADLVDSDFAVLFDRHAAVVHRYLARRAGTGAADDLLAQTFLIAYERRGTYDRTRPDARPWLYGIAGNLLRRRRREEVRQYQAWARTGVDPVAADHAGRVAEAVDAECAAARLAGVLAGLSAADREVLLLVAWGELSYPEVADALDIPIGTVRSRLHRARARIRAAAAKDQGDGHG
ncbi:RNA polymerase sigma factor [Actinocatenispora rupis]|uniref:DNA-directed RNA polymerase sigma-70 factor n=1 Tax=Actinocatenispora rupis TaxID=519421 RepID=A0A8J3JED8_9ACTN|nr:RNA polymerase sigma factor [Actinocatenispora rupis]GID15174.1 DNA-directed RNA polymerase sigma-70 factor [Actinocatenispora rupis]